MTATDSRPNVDYGPRDLALRGEILRSVVGSTVHGTNLEGQDDIDQTGIYIPPAEYVCGLRDAGTHVWRTQPEGVRSGPGDIDLTIHTLRKFLALATDGNPTILALFWTPPSALVVRTEEGDRLRALAPSVVSRRAGQKFWGYLVAQHDRMDGRGKQNRVPNRPELIAMHGYDVKYAAHALRLGLQGEELMRTGRLALPMEPGDRELVMSVRRGDVGKEHARAMILRTSDRLAALLDDPALARLSPLPARPDMDAVNAYLVDAHHRAWEQAATTPAQGSVTA